MANAKICVINECSKAAKSRRMCSTHHSQWLSSPEGIAVKGRANGTLPHWLKDHVDWTGEECLTWPFSRMPKGYPCALTIDGIKTYAHRHMCRLKHGDPPSPDMDAAHSCGKGHEGCVNPNHLRWATRASNMADSVRQGSISRGRDRHNAALDEQMVRLIRSMLADTRQKDVAAKLGISKHCVQQVASKATWAWVE